MNKCGKGRIMNKFKILIAVIVLFSTASFNAQSDDDMKKMIMKAYDLFNTHDVTKEKASEFIDENYIDHTPDPGQLPGIDGFVQSFANFKKAFPDYKITVNDMVVNKEDEKIAVLITISGTNTGEMMGMPATGKKVEFGGMDYLVLKKGKCTDRWGYFDTMTMMQQLGMMK